MTMPKINFMQDFATRYECADRHADEQENIHIDDGGIILLFRHVSATAVIKL